MWSAKQLHLVPPTRGSGELLGLTTIVISGLLWTLRDFITAIACIPDFSIASQLSSMID